MKNPNDILHHDTLLHSSIICFLCSISTLLHVIKQTAKIEVNGMLILSVKLSVKKPLKFINQKLMLVCIVFFGTHHRHQSRQTHQNEWTITVIKKLHKHIAKCCLLLARSTREWSLIACKTCQYQRQNRLKY